jgi:hypothetical protein
MNILIAGDSWGCGVWHASSAESGKIYFPNNEKEKPIYPALLHKGVEFFLTLRGYNVRNISVSGYSNLRIYDSIKQVKDLNSFDFIFVFYTNPLRDMCKNFNTSKFTFNPDLLNDEKIRFYLSAEKRSLNYNDYTNIIKLLIDRYKNKLQSLDYNKKLYLIGGHNKISSSLQTSKINILIPSLREFFYKDFVEPEVVYAPVFENFIEKFDFETLEKLEIEKNYYINLPNIQREFFYPDGFHLNVNGHKILSDHLHNFIQSQ